MFRVSRSMNVWRIGVWFYVYVCVVLFPEGPGKGKRCRPILGFVLWCLSIINKYAMCAYLWHKLLLIVVVRKLTERTGDMSTSQFKIFAVLIVILTIYSTYRFIFVTKQRFWGTKLISFQIPLHNTIAVQGTEFEEIRQEVREYFLTFLCPAKIAILRGQN